MNTHQCACGQSFEAVADYREHVAGCDVAQAW
jgi:hypothetical protein